jgi:hypothetical protein
MIADIFLKGMEVLEILRDQLLKETEKANEENDEHALAVYDTSPIGKDGKMTFGFAGMRFFVKIRVKFRSQRGFNQYDGLLDWGIEDNGDALGGRETVKVTNEYKWTEKRIFLVETIDDQTKSSVIKDEDTVFDCSTILHNNMYMSLLELVRETVIVSS